MNRVCGTNSTSRRFISGRVLTILAMLAAALASHGPDPLVFSAGRQQQPQLPTVFIIGDSTVKTPTEGQQGWGDPIADLFDQTRIKVENHARGGRSSRTFQTEGLWDQILAQMKPGDFVLMQFGHNDGGAINDTSRARGSLRGVGEETEEIDNLLTKKHEVVHTYGWYMRKFVTDTKAKGAIPIVLSPIPRNIWKDGKVVRAVATYGGWAAEVAKSQGACFVDLNEIVAKQYEVMGPEKVKEYFPTDHTHTNPLGARLNAEAVASGLRGLKNCSLAAFLLKHTEIKHKNDPTNSHEMALRIGSASKGCGTGKTALPPVVRMWLCPSVHRTVLAWAVPFWWIRHSRQQKDNFWRRAKPHPNNRRPSRFASAPDF